MSTTIETITVTRPMKVIAFTCCTITVFLMVASVSCSDWVNSDGWREGLFVQCIDLGAPTPLPFDTEAVFGCHRAHSAGYVRGTAALAVICLLTDFFGTLMTGLGLRSTDPNKKYKYYRVAIYSLLVATISLLLALIIYPVSFSKEMDNEPPYNGGRVAAARNFGSLDFDNDGIPDHLDDDDDNDGKTDDIDDDDDNDGIKDILDEDDDNDGIADVNEGGRDDFDGDGIPDDEDTDDDNDGIDDEKDIDDDNDGIPDNVDQDDDNDGIPDSLENDSDMDGIADDDNDGKLDTEDIDSDGDGIPDAIDEDDDNDGQIDDEDLDDDNDGIPDSEDVSGNRRVWQFGFGYGASWFCVIILFASVALLICDRESEEIFYKERPVEDGEEDGDEAEEKA